MTLGDLASVERRLDSVGKEQQAKSVRDRDARTADSIRNIGLGQAKFVDELAVGRGFFEGDRSDRMTFSTSASSSWA